MILKPMALHKVLYYAITEGWGVGHSLWLLLRTPATWDKCNKITISRTLVFREDTNNLPKVDQVPGADQKPAQAGE